jgi:hypothetical protein
VSRRERIGRLFPAPLAAVAIFLVALIILTPVLQSNGQPAPGILTQADLVVDRVPGSNVTHFYVHGVGTTVRYSEMSIEVASGFAWTGGYPSGPLNWTVGANATDSLAIVFETTYDPVAVNVTAYYTASGGSAYYVGLIVFYVAPGGGGTDLVLASGTPGLAVPSSVAFSDLPYTIALPNVGGGPP